GVGSRLRSSNGPSPGQVRSATSGSHAISRVPESVPPSTSEPRPTPREMCLAWNPSVRTNGPPPESRPSHAGRTTAADPPGGEPGHRTDRGLPARIESASRPSATPVGLSPPGGTSGGADSRGRSGPVQVDPRRPGRTPALPSTAPQGRSECPGTDSP